MVPTRLLLPASLLALLSSPAFAADRSLDAIRQEIEQMRRDYESRISDLETRLKKAEDSAGQSAAKAEAAEQAARQVASAPAVVPAAPAAANNAFNPAIGVVLNGTFAAMDRDPAAYRIPGFQLANGAKPGQRGFALGESEVNLNANIDHALFGNLTVSLDRDNTVSVEEGYIQTTALPWGLTVRAGRFFSGIGYLNEQHAHTWDFADAPLPYRAMLADQYGDDGVQVRWLASTAMFLELGAEGFRGDAFPADGAGNRGVGGASAFVHVGDDIGEAGEGGSWRAGLSHLWTKAQARTNGTDVFTGDDHTYIADAVYKWAPNGNFNDRYIKLQAEAFLRREAGQLNGIGYAATQNGFYVQGVYQFIPQWRVGLRYDQVASADPGAALAGSVVDPQGHVGRRESAMIDYSTSEFGRFRLQGNLDQSQPKTDKQILLQYTVSLGAHGAHIF